MKRRQSFPKLRRWMEKAGVRGESREGMLRAAEAAAVHRGRKKAEQEVIDMIIGCAVIWGKLTSLKERARAKRLVEILVRGVWAP